MANLLIFRPSTQTLLRAAAAEPTGHPALLWRADHDLGFTPDAASPAQAEDLLILGPVIRFRHPLVRSAIYHSATLAERRRIHRALAAATDPGQDPDRRAWHLSEAAVEPDEDVAAGLERAADRAMTRGGWAASAAFLTRAAVLSPATRPPRSPAPCRGPRRKHRPANWKGRRSSWTDHETGLATRFRTDWPNGRRGRFIAR